ncbi:hypothetical protein AKO1_009475 [Acrasis kona]|uniref:Uncharacterized protein n=1 Tax=Acrasis kona TaxID=1008807 RepID=A0AAW2ZM41_9EUKA
MKFIMIVGLFLILSLVQGYSRRYQRDSRWHNYILREDDVERIINKKFKHLYAQPPTTPAPQEDNTAGLGYALI